MRVRLAGELDIATEDQFAALVGSLDRDGYHRLIVDLAEVQLCDARGLAALLSAHDLLEAAGGHLTLTGVPPLTREMLVITDLIDVFDLG
jgi:anti-anti-sigma factor